MKQYDLQPVEEIALEPVQLSRSDTGARWELTEESFLRWWRALAEEDRAEFGGLYFGDEIHARFVCALDYLTMMKAQPQSGATIVEAYAIAAGLPSKSESARLGAAACWKHDAVQSLIDRLRYRSNRQAAARITNRTTAVIESLLLSASDPEADGKDKERAVNAALKFLRMVSDEDIQERVERTRRGMANARRELSVEEQPLTEDNARLSLMMLVNALGPEKVKELLG